MGIHQIVFWLLSIMTLVFAIGVIMSRNPISSVLFLILTFFTISGHYVMLNAQFLAIVNIIVYAGAIMVLFLFVIMLMNLNSDTEPQKNVLEISLVKDFVYYSKNELKLNIIGLMCIPPLITDPTRYFLELKKLAEINNLQEISMGMSNDFEKAIECGATFVRIGSAIFNES
jgi:uncharacterized MnhB-related membrane protein